jgi:hypothetical protein
MNRLRRHRWRNHISLLAVLALAWAQIALASHPACTTAAMDSSPAHAQHTDVVPAGELPSCHGEPAGCDEPLCASHCSQGELSKDAPRLLYVPMLGQPPIMPVLNLRQSAHAAGHTAAENPRVAWHRPTSHPASLLLI